MLPQRITAIALAAAAVLVAVAAILAGDASRADACPTTDPACTRVAGGIGEGWHLRLRRWALL